MKGVCSIVTVMSLTLSAFCLAQNSSRHQAAVQLYVAPYGSDSNAGTISKPFKTLERAQRAVRQKRTLAEHKSIEVFLRNGEYALSKPLQFSPDDGGDSISAVVYKGYPGERAIISSAIDLPRTWKRDDRDKTLWELNLTGCADSTKIRSLFRNGVGLNRSSSDTLLASGPLPDYIGKYGAYDFKAIKSLQKDNALAFCGFQYTPSEIPKFARQQDIEVLVYHSWEASWHTIHQIDPVNKVMVFTSPFRYPAGFFDGAERYLIQNAKEYLQKTNTWCYEQKTKTLWLRLPSDVNPNNARFTIPKLSKLIVIRGDIKTGKPVQNLIFSNIEFEMTKSEWAINDYPKEFRAANQNKYPWIRFNDGFSSAQMSISSGECISLDFAVHCKISGCKFRNLGNYAINIGDFSSDNSVDKCRIEQTGGGGIIIGSTDTRSPEIVSGVSRFPSHNAVTSNIIRRIGTVHPSSVGIAITNAAYTHVKGNRIENVPYSGISCGFTFGFQKNPSKSNLIEENYINGAMQQLADGGGIYTLGRQPGTVFRKNFITNVHRNKHAIGGKNNGFFFDEGSSEFIVEENAVTKVANTDIRFNQTDSTKVGLRNNYFERQRQNRQTLERLNKRWNQ